MEPLICPQWFSARLAFSRSDVFHVVGLILEWNSSNISYSAQQHHVLTLYWLRGSNRTLSCDKGGFQPLYRPPAVPRRWSSHWGSLPPLHPPGWPQAEGRQLRDHRVSCQCHPLFCLQVCVAGRLRGRGSAGARAWPSCFAKHCV